jgi:hypothetical protein
MKIIDADWLFKQNRRTEIAALSFAKTANRVNFVRHGSMHIMEKRKRQVEKQKKIKKNLN